MTSSDSPASAPSVPDHQSLGVTLRRHVSQVGRWEAVRWEVDGITLADTARDDRRPDENTLESHGVMLRLYRDQVTEYHDNLQSGAPRLFLICNVDIDDGTPVPHHATLCQAEAVENMETDDEVLSCPLPSALLDWLNAWLQLVPIAVNERGGKKGKRRLRGADRG